MYRPTYYFYLNCPFFGIPHFVCPAAGLRSLVCVIPREPACTPRRGYESRPRSVARALGIRSLEFWQITTGNRSDLLEPSRKMETPQFQMFLSAAGCCCIMSDHSGPRACCRVSHGTATVVHQALLFVTATDIAFSCVCGCGPPVNLRRK